MKKIENMKFYEVIDIIPYSMCIVNDSNKITYKNKYYKNIFNKTNDFISLINSRERNEARRKISHIRKTRGKFSKLITKYDSKLSEIRMYKYSDQLSLIFIEQLIGEKKEKQFEKGKQKVANEKKELIFFLDSIFHDLRTPMVSIASFASYLKDEQNKCLNTECNDYLERLLKNIEYSKNLIDDLETYSKLEYSKLQKEKHNLYSIIDNAIFPCSGKKYKKDLEEYKFIFNNDIEINVKDRWKKSDELNEIFPIVFCDFKLISRVISNLLDNALKYSSVAPNPTIEIYIKDNPNNVHCFVRNNGIKILTSDKKNVIKPLVRGKNISDEYKGSGLGLSIADRILKLHDSSIRIDIKNKTIVSFSLDKPKA
ncbi:MAG: HAMP domain-containing histidine kinase [Thermoplasmata archaeon]|nr:HAMP domain-containing histidine kinase [Thermoplasmata archaeon]